MFSSPLALGDDSLVHGVTSHLEQRRRSWGCSTFLEMFPLQGQLFPFRLGKEGDSEDLRCPSSSEHPGDASY